MSNSLPTITNLSNAVQYLKIWQQQLNPVVSSPKPPRSPFNLVTKSVAGTTGIALSWETVRGADGYVIYYSDTGDFSANNVLTKITNPAQKGFFDDLNASGKTRYYKIASTAGTQNAPQSVLGNTSAPISATTGVTATSSDTTSHTTGGGGWNRPIRPRTGLPF